MALFRAEPLSETVYGVERLMISKVSVLALFDLLLRTCESKLHGVEASCGGRGCLIHGGQEAWRSE